MLYFGTINRRKCGGSERVLQPMWDHLVFHYYPLVSSPFFPVLLKNMPAFHNYKIQGERHPTMPMMLKSLGMAIYNHVVFVTPGVLLLHILVPAPNLPALAPTVWEVFSGSVGLLLIFDTQYFFWHMIHHKNVHLYKWVHAIHHEYVSPFSWSTQHLSIFELVTLGFWSHLDPILFKSHPLTTWILTIFSIWMSVENHIGYNLPWTLNYLVPFGLLGGAPAHDIHHQKPSRNFAPFFTHWDRILGTHCFFRFYIYIGSTEVEICFGFRPLTNHMYRFPEFC
uniref:Fatty acid hydroxylase domain-containing protein n=1 Tax=Denticeps clupeoides TaxID=299321 RepID=A0AAY4C536_9TELE